MTQWTAQEQCLSSYENMNRIPFRNIMLSFDTFNKNRLPCQGSKLGLLLHIRVASFFVCKQTVKDDFSNHILGAIRLRVRVRVGVIVRVSMVHSCQHGPKKTRDVLLISLAFT